MPHLLPSSSLAAAPHARLEAESLLQFLEWCRSPKVFMPMTRPDMPTYRSHPNVEALFHRDTCRDVRRQHAVAVFLRLPLEDFPENFLCRDKTTVVIHLGTFTVVTRQLQLQVPRRSRPPERGAG